MQLENRKKIKDLWFQVLVKEPVDRESDSSLDQSFVDLGGTSLQANQFVARLFKETGVRISVIRIFEHPTLRSFLNYCETVDFFRLDSRSPDQSPGNSTEKLPEKLNAEPIEMPSNETDPSPKSPKSNEKDIAIIGMSCRFPGANSIDQFWKNLEEEKESLHRFTDEELKDFVPADLLADPRYVKVRGLIDKPFHFDAEFFDISPMEAKLIDPQQRILLEVAHEALEHSGETKKDRVAVYAGIEDNTYYKNEILPYPDAEKRAGRFLIMTGNEKDFVAMRIAHRLGLNGPAVSVHTACSTSLVAVITACKSLQTRDCDLAIAGGSSVHFPSQEGIYFQEGGVFSSDGSCRPFDSEAEGTNFTDGAGVVVLKRLSDAIKDQNTIYAVIKGGAINNDGGDRASFSSPSVTGQANCIDQALKDANVDPSTIQYVEAHGTATPVGDPIEVEALSQVYRKFTNKNQFCGLGSVKGNIGHTTAAAGVASLIKTALALKNEKIPATLHFKKPNPDLHIESSPFYVTSKLTPWPKTKSAKTLRRAGLSSFGIGGTNSHVILEEAHITHHQTTESLKRPFEILPLSAKSKASRDEWVANDGKRISLPNKQDHSKSDDELRNSAYTFQTGRLRYPYRASVVRFSDEKLNDLITIRESPLSPKTENPSLVFMFPGQGAQYLEMGKTLYDHFPEFRSHFDQCSKYLDAAFGFDFKTFLFQSSQRPDAQALLENTRYTQPALFAIETSLGKMLFDWGIKPKMMIGHSIGEFAAAYLAGIFSLEDGVKLITARGQLMSDLPSGKMLSVRGNTDDVIQAMKSSKVHSQIDIASINSPKHSVIAGPTDAIAEMQTHLDKAGFICKLLHTSHAFHSQMMNPVVEPFLEVAKKVRYSAPNIPIVSTANGNGTIMTSDEAMDPAYWANHLRATVTFSKSLLTAMQILNRNAIFLEVGPRTTLSSLSHQHLPSNKDALNLSSISLLGESAEIESELVNFANALSKMWLQGYELPWTEIWQEGRKVPVPFTPLEKKEFRFSTGRTPTITRPLSTPAATSTIEEQNYDTPTSSIASKEESTSDLVASELKALFAEFAGQDIVSPQSTFVENRLDSLVLMQIGVELGKRYGISISLRDLMEKINTLFLLADFICKNASEDRLPKRIQKPLVQQTETKSIQRSVQMSPVMSLSPDQDMDLVSNITLQLKQMKDILSLQIQMLENAGSNHSKSYKQPSITTPAIKNDPVTSSGLVFVKHAIPPKSNALRRLVTDSNGVNQKSNEWFEFEQQTKQYKSMIDLQNVSEFDPTKNRNAIHGSEK